ncbi:MAG: glutathione S-transferase family protein [Pseudomonadota bacterium]
MIDLYTSTSTPSQRTSIMLEETGIRYRAHMMGRGIAKPRELLQAYPLGRQPTIIDHTGPDGKDVVLTQSIAIVLYLAEKSGRLLPAAPRARVACLEAVMFHGTDLYPAFASAYYMRGIKPEAQPVAAAWWEARMEGYFKEFDARLRKNTYIVGDQYSAADVIAYSPALMAMRDFKALAKFKNVKRWLALVGARPAVKKGMKVSSR